MNPGGLKIGVFDSGFGGLTVLRALLPLLPGADFFYLGDTARLPYGSKSRATIVRYALSSTHFLLDRGAGFLVIACNTASALALDEIRAASPVPVLGVIETGAAEAQRCSRSEDILVIGTDATIASHAYAAACRERGLRAMEKACPLLVPLVEEGWVDHPVTREVVRIYLTELFDRARRAQMQPDVLLLGCTHYPLLRSAIQSVIRSTIPAIVPGEIRVIDSAEATAERVARDLAQQATSLPSPAAGTRHFFATDSVEKFRSLGARFLGSPIDEVALVDLGG